MRSLLILLFLFIGLITTECFSQTSTKVIDSLYYSYQRVTTADKKVESAGAIAFALLTTNSQKADSFRKLCLEHAELSRNRKLIVHANQVSARCYLLFAGIKENAPKAAFYFDKAYRVASESKLDKEAAASLLGLAELYRATYEVEKAMSFTSQAFALLGSEPDCDSLRALSYLSFADNYMLRKEKLLALKNYFNAQKVAELAKDHSLTRRVTLKLVEFYASTEDYDKAIDYAIKAANIQKEKSLTAVYDQASDLLLQGKLFDAKGQNEIAKKMFDNALRIADSLGEAPLKNKISVAVFEMYLNDNMAEEALAFFNSNASLQKYIKLMGLECYISYAYAYLYTQLNRLDSAGLYYQKALSGISQLDTETELEFSIDYANYLIKSGNHDEAIRLLEASVSTAREIGEMEYQKNFYSKLDSVYRLKTDYRNALHFATLSQRLKDTLNLLARQEDLLQLQLQDEEERQVRMLKAEEEDRKRRYQFQYLAITIGIAMFFVLLVMMGTFKVSKTTIRIVGFFTFIMAFEFVFLILKKYFHAITHEEPWKDLVVMIGLAAFLLPLHHWLEHKVIHYLTSRQLIRLEKGRTLLNKLLRKPARARKDFEVTEQENS